MIYTFIKIQNDSLWNDIIITILNKISNYAISKLNQSKSFFTDDKPSNSLLFLAPHEARYKKDSKNTFCKILLNLDEQAPSQSGFPAMTASGLEICFLETPLIPLPLQYDHCAWVEILNKDTQQENGESGGVLFWVKEAKSRW